MGSPFADWDDTRTQSEAEYEDLTTAHGCTVRVRHTPMPGYPASLEIALLFDMGARDGRVAEVRFTPQEANTVAHSLRAAYRDSLLWMPR